MVIILLPVLSEQFCLNMPHAVLAAVLRDHPNLDYADVETMLAVGTGLNAIGKFFGGIIIDWQGARAFLRFSMPVVAMGAMLFSAASMVGATTLAMGYATMQLFASGGWLAGCKLIEATIPRQKHAIAFTVLGLGSRIGATLARLLLASMLHATAWQNVSRVAAVVVAICWMIAMCTVPDPPLRREDATSTAEGVDKRRADAEGEDETLNAPTHRDVSAQASDVRRIRGIHGILSVRGMQVNMFIAMCVYTVYLSMENLCSLLVRYLTDLTDSEIGMATSLWPAGSFLSLLVSAPLYSCLRRSNKFKLEVAHQIVPSATILVLLLGAMQRVGGVKSDGFTVCASLFSISFGLSLTYYVTVNQLPLVFEECATASGILEVASLASAVSYQMCVANAFDSVGDDAWIPALGFLSAFSCFAVLGTMVLYRNEHLTPHMSLQQLPGEVVEEEIEFAEVVGHHHSPPGSPDRNTLHV